MNKQKPTSSKVNEFVERAFGFEFGAFYRRDPESYVFGKDLGVIATKSYNPTEVGEFTKADGSALTVIEGGSTLFARSKARKFSKLYEREFGIKPEITYVTPEGSPPVNILEKVAMFGAAGSAGLILAAYITALGSEIHGRPADEFLLNIGVGSVAGIFGSLALLAASRGIRAYINEGRILEQKLKQRTIDKPEIDFSPNKPSYDSRTWTGRT